MLLFTESLYFIFKKWNIWKNSDISLFHKSRDISDVNSCRAVCKSNVSAKLSDYLVFKVLSNLFYEAYYTRTIRFFVLKKQILEKNIVDNVRIDFKKQFDMVNIKLLSRKLKKYGIGGNLIEWF